MRLLFVLSSALACACGGGVSVPPVKEAPVLPVAPPVPNAPPAESAAEIDPIAACAPGPRLYPDDPAGLWVSGPGSKLCTTLTEVATHDGSQGKTRIVFASDEPDGARALHELEGRFRVLGHTPAARAFVIGGLFETGTAVLMDRLALIDDRDGSLRWSSYRGPLHIASALMSPDGTALALIAAPDGGNEFRLWLYRVADDALLRLGPAPAPPPSTFDCDRPQLMRWLDLERHGGYVDLDPGVITFPGTDQLRASYGRDTCEARAKQRRTRDWDLTKLGEPWQQAPASVAE
jgi:hypothetical protein